MSGSREKRLLTWPTHSHHGNKQFAIMTLKRLSWLGVCALHVVQRFACCSCEVELPDVFVPLLVLWMDQCHVQVSGGNFVIFALSAAILIFEDLYHRDWNDCKLVAKRVQDVWRTIIHLKAAFDMNYAPASNRKHWFRYKQRALSNFLASTSSSHDLFQSYIAAICFDRDIPLPNCKQDEDTLWQSLSSAVSFQQQGPQLKLMKWFSFEVVSLFWKDDDHATKMILSHATTGMDAVDAAALDFVPEAIAGNTSASTKR